MDIDAYFERIGGPAGADRTPSLVTLQRLHRAHATTIPFENLDLHLGKPINIDIHSIEQKLVGARRGGYCFEQNRLFATALETLGFGVEYFAARVHIGGPADGPRTHMVLAVTIPEHDGRWIADVGFGSAGCLSPIPFTDGGESTHGVWTHRITRRDHDWLLQIKTAHGWHDLYSFNEDPQLPSDYELANWWTSTHPDSGFVQRITAQFPSEAVQYVLRGNDLQEYTPEGVTTKSIEDPDELLAVLRDQFTIDLPPGTRFRVPNAANCS